MAIKKSMSKNAILNLTKSMLAVIFPLITYPYALRVLGATNIGKVSYVSSIVSYFGLIASLGINSYGVREGAKYRDNRKESERFASEVFSINIISTTIAVFMMILFVIFIENLREYKNLFAILGLSIIFNTFGVDWINVIYEDYFIVAVRSIVIYTLSFILLYTLVKAPDDYYMYAVLQILGSALICVSNWFYCRKYVKLHFTLHMNLKKHIKTIMVLFVSAVTISIYVNSDMTMLGIFKGDHEVGLYSAAVKVYNVVKNGLAAIYSVTVPRMAYYYANNMMGEFKTTYSKIFGTMIIIMLPSMVGLVGFSSEIMSVIGGEEYAPVSMCLALLAVALSFAILGGLVTACLNLTIKREKDNLIATAVSGCINCGLNLFFIPFCGIEGAAITTIISEAFVLIFCFLRVPDKEKYFDFIFLKKEILNAVIGCIGIMICLYIIKISFNNKVVSLVIGIIGSVFIYGILLVIRKDAVAEEYLTKVLRRIDMRK